MNLTLHIWGRCNESSFKCKVIHWVAAEKVRNNLVALQLFWNLYRIGTVSLLIY